jgi:hypothetical protein
MLFNCIIVAVLLRIYHEITLESEFAPKTYFLKTKVKGKMVKKEVRS